MIKQAAAAKDHLALKWGRLKGWDFTHNETAAGLMEKYVAFGCSMGAAQQRDTPEQKELILQMIDAVDCPIYLDWEGKYVTKDEAKDYVKNYRR